MEFLMKKGSTANISTMRSVLMHNKSILSHTSRASDDEEDYQMVINLLARERNNVEQLWTRLNAVIRGFNEFDDRVVAFYLAQRELKQDAKQAITEGLHVLMHNGREQGAKGLQRRETGDVL